MRNISFVGPAAPEFDIAGNPFGPMCEYRPDFDEPAEGAALRPIAGIFDTVIRPEPEDE